MEYGTKFREAFKVDLANAKMSEASLAKRLGIKQQAVNKWVGRGFPPLSRLQELRDIFGPTSELSKMDHSALYGGGRTKAPKAEWSRQSEAKDAAEIGRDIVDLRQRWTEQMREFQRHLPGRLRQNAIGRFVTGGPQNNVTRLDYASESVIAEVVIKDGQVVSKNTSAAILRMLTYKKQMESPAQLVLILLTSSPEAPMGSLFAPATKAFGIRVVHAGNPEDAAQQIAELEGQGDAYELIEPDE